jgi:hypothetical protein
MMVFGPSGAEGTCGAANFVEGNPQGLKPFIFVLRFGTTEVVPFQNFDNRCLCFPTHSAKRCGMDGAPKLSC